MLVLNLVCAHGHHFEGWFGSAADFESQLERTLVSCPLCGDSHITRLPSAPRLNVSGAKPPAGNDPATSTAPAQALQRQMLQAVQQVLARTEDVGDRFAEEARRIHYGEAQQRGIRGQASRADAEALADEGIAVMALPIPEALKGTIQ